MNATVVNLLLFVVLPYVALAIFVLGTTLRYRRAPYTFSSRSSQFLEGEQHFFALNAFHYGILIVFLGHLAGLLTPARMHVWTATPLRLYTLEVIGLAGALTALIGIFLVIFRRVRVPLVAKTTRPSDALVLGLLGVQMLTGIQIAIFHPWGAAWFEALMGPYLRSLLTFTPKMGYVAAMPLVIKLHVIGAWAILAVFPFTRLVHMLALPLEYLWRKFQIVRWNRPRTATRDLCTAKLEVK